MMPPAVRGVINLRGAVVPVVDLGMRFGRGPAVITRRSCIVVVEGQGDDRRDMGVLVDAVCAVLEIADQDIEQAPPFGARLRQDFIAGLAKMNERFVIVLDLAQVLSVAELAGAEATAEPSCAD
jgi:purine-binding chemotaxis protein CheW